jgi:ADP-heptose:LPS heptosyltransferase
MSAAFDRRLGLIRWAAVLILRWVTIRWAARPLRRQVRSHYRVAIVKLDRLGDAVLATGAIRLIVDAFGEAHCLLVISRYAEPLLEREFPNVSRLVLPIAMGHRALPAEAMAARRVLSRIRCHDVVCLRHQREDWDELVLSWLAGERTVVLEENTNRAKKVVHRLFQFSKAKRFVFDRSQDEQSGICRELLRHQQLLSAALGKPIDARTIQPSLRTPICVGPRKIVVSPFTSTPIKDIAFPSLLAALHAARARSDTDVILVGTPAQSARLQGLLELLRRHLVRGVEFAVDMDLRSFIATIAAAELVISADTATAHIATTLDRPTLVLLGGGHYGEFGPWHRSSRQMWLTHHLDCFGCMWNCRHFEPLCLTKIRQEDIARAIAQLYAAEQKEVG